MSEFYFYVENGMYSLTIDSLEDHYLLTISKYIRWSGTTEDEVIIGEIKIDKETLKPFSIYIRYSYTNFSKEVWRRVLAKALELFYHWYNL